MEGEFRVRGFIPVNVPVDVTRKAFIGRVRCRMMGNRNEPSVTPASPAARPMPPPTRPPFTVALSSFQHCMVCVTAFSYL